MTDRIADTFARLKTERRAALIPYITAGDPDLETTFAAVKTLAAAGADMLELGIPFTDPVADGPVIQKACDRALLNAFSLADILAMVRRLRNDGVDIPIVLMSYANPIFAMGYDAFARDAAAHGVDAVLITDIPPEESGDYCQAAAAHGLKTVFLCSPTTAPDRLARIDAASTAYVYYIAHAGVTGARSELPPDIKQTLQTLRARLKNPLCVGFGISTPDHAASLAPHADGLIVGSAVVKFFETSHGDALQDNLSSLIRSLKDATGYDSAAA